MEPLDHQRKHLVLKVQKFSKANTKFCLLFHNNADSSYLFVYGKEIFNFKANNKNINFPTQLGSISNGFSNTESREVSLNRNMYEFSVAYSSIDKSDILTQILPMSTKVVCQ